FHEERPSRKTPGSRRGTAAVVGAPHTNTQARHSMSVEPQALERSVLERKQRDELQTIAEALGMKPTSGARKAELVDQILREAGIENGEEPSKQKRARTSAKTADSVSDDGDAPGDAPPDAVATAGDDPSASETVGHGAGP